MNDEKQIKAFFDTLIKELKMVPLSGLLIKSDTKSGDRGISAVQLITTSSITFHSDDEGECIFLDVFSCKDFNRKIPSKLIKKFFDPKDINDKFIYRNAGHEAKWVD